VVLAIFGFLKISSDNRESRRLSKERLAQSDKIDSLEKTTRSLQSTISTLGDTISINNRFMKNLKDQYHIVKDSNNQPKIYNTHIKNAKEVNFY
jgi:phosphoglycerate-specific signal transduction histidine kinase